MKFSTIADRFLHSLGYEPKLCSSDEEARREAAAMPENPQEWPVVYFKSDTTGEKDYEEFFVDGEKLDMDRFSSLGVIEESAHRPKAEVDAFLDRLETLFDDDAFTKEDVVAALKDFLPNFEHEEKGKNLDQKM